MRMRMSLLKSIKDNIAEYNAAYKKRFGSEPLSVDTQEGELITAEWYNSHNGEKENKIAYKEVPWTQVKSGQVILAEQWDRLAQVKDDVKDNLTCGCQNGCEAVCIGSCGGTCIDGCDSTCAELCGENCTSGCGTNCGENCQTGCSVGCKDTAKGADICAGGCGSHCSGAAYGGR